jgi:hypothetical protein
MSDDVEDRALLSLGLSGDAKAFVQLRRKYEDWLADYVRERAGDLATVELVGLVNAIFLEIATRLDDSVVYKVRLEQIAREKLFAYFEASHTLPLASEGGPIPGTEDEYWREFAAALSKEDRYILDLILSGNSLTEIAHKLNLPYDRVLRVIERARTITTKNSKDMSAIESIFRHLLHGERDQELEVFIDPGDSPPELIAELYTAISVLYRSCGGSGLEIVKEERRSFAAEVL